ncbi:hypothetical protein PG993_009230 [Apiospora rasikravindrae]|uniref:Rhodopsin domain-containing protein n=1 Tax=Apiospora rasikravindrae TaxID=990691 RepID=A0ABR1SKK8_9PEZI
MDPGRESYLAQDRSTTTLVSTWSVTGAAFIVALARLYVRAIMRHNVRSDDYFIGLSVAASIASCALTSLAVAHGLGRHTEALSREDQVAVTTWTYIAFCPGVMSFAIPKLAVIALLVRLLAPRKSHYLLLWGMGITVQLTLLATVGILIRVIDEKCPPFNDTRLDPPEHCVPIHVQVKWCLFAGSNEKAQVRCGGRLQDNASDCSRRPRLHLLCAYHKQQDNRCPYLPLLEDKLANQKNPPSHRAEGSTIVIAASIPILQPLMERACGVNCIECRRGRFKTYIEFITSRGKLTTAIQRRVQDLNDSAVLAETDVEAAHNNPNHHNHDNSNRQH